MSAFATQGGHKKLKPDLVASYEVTTSGLEKKMASSYFGAL